MAKYTKIAFVFLLTVTVAFSSLAQDIGEGTEILSGQRGRRIITTAVPFLMISPDARASGMGDVGAATSPDANSTYWNPAKLAYLESDQGGAINYTPWLKKIVHDMSISYLSGYYKLSKEQTIAATMRYFDQGSIQFTDELGNELNEFKPTEFSFEGTYSRMLSPNLGVGLTGKFIYSNLSGSFSGNIDSKPGTSAAADVGVYYHKDVIIQGYNTNIAFGGVMSNIGSKLTYSGLSDKDFIPTNLRIGTAVTVDIDAYNSITVAVDGNKLMVPTPPERDANGVITSGMNPDRPLLSGMFQSFYDAPGGMGEEIQEIIGAIGIEYWYNKTFAGRLGYYYEDATKGSRKYITLGLGFRYQVFGIDFAYLIPETNNHPLAETLRFSLLFNFEKLDQNIESVTQ